MNAFSSSGSVLSMAFSSGIVVGGVLIALFLCSVISWAVIVYKYMIIRRATVESREFIEVFWETKNFQTVMSATEDMENSPVAVLFRSGYREWKRLRDRIASASEESNGDLTAEIGGIDSIERALRRTTETEAARLERMLVFLATVASATPFIGLFGTVWGIMDSFREIGITGSANLAVVAPGISEALIATATGLAAAIPAVIAYNYLNNNIKVLLTEMEAFASEFLNIVSHHSSVIGKRK